MQITKRYFYCFTLAEWAQFCHDNPQYLSVNDAPDLEAKVLAVLHGLDNMQEIMTPIEILRQHLSRDQIIAKQKIEYDKIYTACLSSKNFEFLNEHASNKPKYRLITDLLMTYEKGYKILVPPSMVGVLISFVHLLQWAQKI